MQSVRSRQAPFCNCGPLRRSLYFTRLDLHDVQKRDCDQMIVDGLRVIGCRHTNGHCRTSNHRQLGVANLIRPSVRRSASAETAETVCAEGTHEYLPVAWSLPTWICHKSNRQANTILPPTSPPCRGGSAQRRLLRVPVGGLLEHASGTQETLFLERRRLQMQADGQARGTQAARN